MKWKIFFSRFILFQANILETNVLIESPHHDAFNVHDANSQFEFEIRKGLEAMRLFIVYVWKFRPLEPNHFVNVFK